MSSDRHTSPRVLVVSHDSRQLDSFVIGLQLEGMDALGQTDPVEALKHISQRGCDLVLVDLMTPKMNGLQIARHIRDKHPGVKTVLMSDYLLSPVQLAKADTGVVGFIPKPCKLDELVGFIKSKLTDGSLINPREEAFSSAGDNRSRTESPFDVHNLQLATC